MAVALPSGIAIDEALAHMSALYAGRGVELHRVAGGYQFVTAPDLAYLLRANAEEPRKLSRSAMEVLAIIAYHQPVTRAEIEQIRGVSTAKGTLDLLTELKWVRRRGKRRTPGRPTTYGTTPEFLVQFTLDSIQDLPGLDELRGTGLLEGQIPPGFSIPVPNDDSALTTDEDPETADDLADLLDLDAEPDADQHRVAGDRSTD
jgi:segregation and condensation protein B